MSKADVAYRAAVREIALVRAKGRPSLRLFGDRFRALERLPDEIANWTELQSLTLSHTQITDAGLAHVAGLTELQSLTLSHTQITDAGLAHVAGLTGLQSLDLSFTKITDAGLAHVAGLTGLQSLDLMNTQITDAGLAHVAGLTGLQSLELMNTQITDAGLAHVAGLTGLQSLDLRLTQVRDLRPICDLPFDKVGNALSGDFGLHFADTPAAELDETLGELAEVDDHKDRTAKTLAYLRGLPRYPAPLPWLARNGNDPAPDLDPAVPLVVGESGIALNTVLITKDEKDDPLRGTLHKALQSQLEELLRVSANLDDATYRAACKLRDLLDAGLEGMDPLLVHLAIEKLRRLRMSLGANPDRDLIEALESVLEIGPGLTLDTAPVQTFLDRARRNRLEKVDQAAQEAEIRISQSIAATDISAPSVKEVAALAAQDGDDQFTAIRPTLNKNYTLTAAKFVLASAAAGTIGNLATAGIQSDLVWQWLAMNRIDLGVLLPSWGEPFLVWMTPILERAQQIVESGKNLVARIARK